ncbi:MAG: hypothetical protein H0Z22_03560 [Thermosipho sp. (in: Bacteria)]|nr:hypothetical protein [Thermosipho sp. (in: thermotogales)]
MKFDDEFYTKIINIFARRINYTPGSLLEEKIISQIRRRKRFNITKIFVVMAIVVIFVTVVVFSNLNTVNQRSIYSSYENNNIQEVPQKFEPIIDISLVSDGF